VPVYCARARLTGPGAAAALTLAPRRWRPLRPPLRLRVGEHMRLDALEQLGPRAGDAEARAAEERLEHGHGNLPCAPPCPRAPPPPSRCPRPPPPPPPRPRPRAAAAALRLAPPPPPPREGALASSAPPPSARPHAVAEGRELGAHRTRARISNSGRYDIVEPASERVWRRTVRFHEIPTEDSHATRRHVLIANGVKATTSNVTVMRPVNLDVENRWRRILDGHRDNDVSLESVQIARCRLDINVLTVFEGHQRTLSIASFNAANTVR